MDLNNLNFSQTVSHFLESAGTAGTSIGEAVRSLGRTARSAVMSPFRTVQAQDATTLLDPADPYKKITSPSSDSSSMKMNFISQITKAFSKSESNNLADVHNFLQAQPQKPYEFVVRDESGNQTMYCALLGTSSQDGKPFVTIQPKESYEKKSQLDKLTLTLDATGKIEAARYNGTLVDAGTVKHYPEFIELREIGKAEASRAKGAEKSLSVGKTAIKFTNRIFQPLLQKTDFKEPDLVSFLQFRTEGQPYEFTPENGIKYYAWQEKRDGKVAIVIQSKDDYDAFYNVATGVGVRHKNELILTVDKKGEIQSAEVNGKPVQLADHPELGALKEEIQPTLKETVQPKDASSEEAIDYSSYRDGLINMNATAETPLMLIEDGTCMWIKDLGDGKVAICSQPIEDYNNITSINTVALIIDREGKLIETFKANESAVEEKEALKDKETVQPKSFSFSRMAAKLVNSIFRSLLPEAKVKESKDYSNVAEFLKGATTNQDPVQFTGRDGVTYNAWLNSRNNQIRIQPARVVDPKGFMDASGLLILELDNKGNVVTAKLDGQRVELGLHPELSDLKLFVQNNLGNRVVEGAKALSSWNENAQKGKSTELRGKIHNEMTRVYGKREFDGKEVLTVLDVGSGRHGVSWEPASNIKQSINIEGENSKGEIVKAVITKEMIRDQEENTTISILKGSDLNTGDVQVAAGYGAQTEEQRIALRSRCVASPVYFFATGNGIMRDGPPARVMTYVMSAPDLKNVPSVEAFDQAEYRNEMSKGTQHFFNRAIDNGDNFIVDVGFGQGVFAGASTKPLANELFADTWLAAAIKTVTENPGVTIVLSDSGGAARLVKEKLEKLDPALRDRIHVTDKMGADVACLAFENGLKPAVRLAADSSGIAGQYATEPVKGDMREIAQDEAVFFTSTLGLQNVHVPLIPESQVIITDVEAPRIMARDLRSSPSNGKRFNTVYDIPILKQGVGQLEPNDSSLSGALRLKATSIANAFKPEPAEFRNYSDVSLFLSNKNASRENPFEFTDENGKIMIAFIVGRGPPGISMITIQPKELYDKDKPKISEKLTLSLDNEGKIVRTIYEGVPVDTSASHYTALAQLRDIGKAGT